MLENKENIIEKSQKDISTEILSVEQSTDLDTAIDNSLLELPLNLEERKLIGSIIEAPSKDELQKQFDLFNINQSKKNALRIIKLNNLLSKVEDQAIERFEKRPDQVSNKELLEYMTVVSSQIDRAQKSVDSLDMNPAIHVANQKNEVNINVGGNLDRDSKEKVMDAISALLKQVKKDTLDSDANVVDAEIIEESAEQKSQTDEKIITHPDILETPDNKLYNNEDTEESVSEEISFDLLNSEE